MEPSAHLVGSLVGEGHRKDLPGLGFVLAEDVRDAMNQNPRLAAAGAGQDQQRPLGRGGRFVLFRIERFGQVQHRTVLAQASSPSPGDS